MNTTETKPPVISVMADIETLGTRPGSAIASIGAVVFSGGQIIREFYERVDVQSCVDVGMTIDWSTVQWWLSQSEEARAEMTTQEGLISIQYALTLLSNWLGRTEEVELWGNGAAFDNALLAEAYRLTGLPMPWKFWNDRCYRTIKALHPEIKMERTGTHHNALDDARSQAIHLMQMIPTL